VTWACIARELDAGNRRGPEAVARLEQAYRDVAATPAGQIVIADLANHSGWNKVAPPGTPPDRLSEMNGSRAAFGRLFLFLAGMNGWVDAARAEAIADEEEGQI
jgi:hypothetical protein